MYFGFAKWTAVPDSVSKLVAYAHPWRCSELNAPARLHDSAPTAFLQH